MSIGQGDIKTSYVDLLHGGKLFIQYLHPSKHLKKGTTIHIYAGTETLSKLLMTFLKVNLTYVAIVVSLQKCLSTEHNRFEGN